MPIENGQKIVDSQIYAKYNQKHPEKLAFLKFSIQLVDVICKHTVKDDQRINTVIKDMNEQAVVCACRIEQQGFFDTFVRGAMSKQKCSEAVIKKTLSEYRQIIGQYHNKKVSHDTILQQAKQYYKNAEALKHKVLQNSDKVSMGDLTTKMHQTFKQRGELAAVRNAELLNPKKEQMLAIIGNPAFKPFGWRKAKFAQCMVNICEAFRDPQSFVEKFNNVVAEKMKASGYSEKDINKIIERFERESLKHPEAEVTPNKTLSNDTSIIMQSSQPIEDVAPVVLQPVNKFPDKSSKRELANIDEPKISGIEITHEVVSPAKGGCCGKPNIKKERSK